VEPALAGIGLPLLSGTKGIDLEANNSRLQGLAAESCDVLRSVGAERTNFWPPSWSEGLRPQLFWLPAHAALAAELQRELSSDS